MEVKKKWFQSHIFLLSLAIAVAGIYLFFQLSGISPELIEQAKGLNPDLANLLQAIKDKAWGAVITSASAIWIAIRRLISANPTIMT